MRNAVFAAALPDGTAATADTPQKINLPAGLRNSNVKAVTDFATGNIAATATTTTKNIQYTSTGNRV